MKNSNMLSVVTLTLLPLVVAHTQMISPAMQQKITEAKPGDVRVLSTAAFLAPLEAVRAQAEKTIGKPLVIQYGSARGDLKDMIQAGQVCDVTLLLPDVNSELVAQHKLESKQYKMASVLVGLALKGTPPQKLDVSTKEGIKTAFINAAGVRYGATGAGRPTADKIIDTLNIRSAIKGGIMQPGSPRMETELAPGQYEIFINPLSEIVINKSVTNLGPVIPELQVPQVIEASLCASSTERAAAEALIKFLQGPTIEPALEVSGMTR